MKRNKNSQRGCLKEQKKKLEWAFRQKKLNCSDNNRNKKRKWRKNSNLTHQILKLIIVFKQEDKRMNQINYLKNIIKPTKENL